MCHTSPYLCKHLFFSHSPLKPLYASPAFRLNDVVTFVVSVLQLWNCTWCWYSRFLSPCPSSLMTTTVGKKRSQWNRTIYIQVCQPSLFSHPSWLCLLCIAAKQLPLRWTKYGLLILIQRSDQCLKYLRLRMNERSHLNSAWELANLKAEDSISLQSMLLLHR